MANRFTHDRRAHRLIAATATLIVLVAGGCTDGSDETDNGADAELVEQWWGSTIPEPPIVTELTSQVREATGSSSFTASWAGSISARDWPGTEVFLERYDALMAEASFDRGTTNDRFPVAERERWIVNYVSPEYRVDVVVTADDTVVGVVVGVDEAWP